MDVPRVETYAVSIFQRATDNTPRQHAVNLEQLTAALTTFRRHDASDKLHAPAWSPTRYAPGAPRGKDNVIEVSCLVLDFDDGTSIRDVLSGAEQWYHVLHTSWSHTPEHHRFRVIFPLAVPVPGAEWTRAWRYMADRWFRGTPDPKCKDASRIYFLPIFRPRHEHRAWHHAGPLLDIPWEEVEPLPPVSGFKRKVISPRRADYETMKRFRQCPETRRRVAEALGGIIVGDPPIARRIVCPKCGRPDVWFAITPTKKCSVSCNHVNTCGYFSSLYDLAIASTSGLPT